MKDLQYEDRLKRLKLPSLEYRRLRGDMIETFKILNGFYDTAISNSLLNQANQTVQFTRGHSFKLTKQFVKSTKYAHFFTNRIVNAWNSLSTNTVSAGTLNSFKNNFDKECNSKMYRITI